MNGRWGDLERVAARGGWYTPRCAWERVQQWLTQRLIRVSRPCRSCATRDGDWCVFASVLSGGVQQAGEMERVRGGQGVGIDCECFWGFFFSVVAFCSTWWSDIGLKWGTDLVVRRLDRYDENKDGYDQTVSVDGRVVSTFSWGKSSRDPLGTIHLGGTAAFADVRSLRSEQGPERRGRGTRRWSARMSVSGS